MRIQQIIQETFTICGYSVETTLAQNDEDVSALFSDFFISNREIVLKSLIGYKKGFYGLSWDIQGHERYCNLFGVEVGPENMVPENVILKNVPEALCAMAHFAPEVNIINPWREFFYNEIPCAGLKVNEELNLYFEYYPSNVDGEYELWVPVIKADV